MATLPKLAFAAIMLPLKFAVLPVTAKLIVKLLVMVLDATLTKLAVIELPRLELPLALVILPTTVKLPLPSNVAARVGFILPTDVV